MPQHIWYRSNHLLSVFAPMICHCCCWVNGSLEGESGGMLTVWVDTKGALLVCNVRLLPQKPAGVTACGRMWSFDSRLKQQPLSHSASYLVGQSPWWRTGHYGRINGILALESELIIAECHCNYTCMLHRQMVPFIFHRGWPKRVKS